MARIRTIKPEFWEDEAISQLSLRARLLFIATWNLADDEALLRWTPDYVNASAFMYDNLKPAAVNNVMAELVDAGLVFPYVGGRTHQKLAYIVHFHKHQRINRPQPSKLPPPSLQNADVRRMYAERDHWTCHICGETIECAVVGTFYNPYDNPHDYDPVSRALSMDHVHPKIKGGDDYPSNIRASHQSCNKGKGARILPGVNDSLNGSVNDSPPEGKGTERKGTSSSDDGDIVAEVCRRLAEREADLHGDIANRVAWTSSRAAGMREKVEPEVQRVLATHPEATADQLVRYMNGEKRALPTKAVEYCGECSNGQTIDDAGVLVDCECKGRRSA